MANIAGPTGGTYQPPSLPDIANVPLGRVPRLVSSGTTTPAPSSGPSLSDLLGGVGSALGNAWMTATDPVTRTNAIAAAQRGEHQLTPFGPWDILGGANEALTPLLQPIQRPGDVMPETPPIFPGAPLAAATDLASESLGPALGQAGRAIGTFAESPAVRRFATEAAGEGEVGLGIPGAAQRAARYVVNHGKTVHTIMDTQTGKILPLAFKDADRAEQVAAARNAALRAVPSTADAAKTNLERMVASGRNFTRVPPGEAAASEAANPSVVRGGLPTPQEAAAQEAQTRAASEAARRAPKPGGFAAPGTTFAGVSPRDLTKTIQATTPYRSIKEFGAAVRSGEAAKNGAPQGLIDVFERGEADMARRAAEDAMRSRGASQELIDRTMGRAPRTAPAAAFEREAAAAQEAVRQRLNALTSTTETTRPVPTLSGPIASVDSERAGLEDLIRREGQRQGLSDDEIRKAIAQMGGGGGRRPPAPPAGGPSLPRGPAETVQAAKLRAFRTLFQTFVYSNMLGPGVAGLKAGSDMGKMILGTVQIPLARLLTPGAEAGSAATREAVLWRGFIRGVTQDAMRGFATNSYQFADTTPGNFTRLMRGEAGKGWARAAGAVNVASVFRVMPRLFSGVTAAFLHGWHDLSLYDQAVQAARGLRGAERDRFISDFQRNVTPEVEKTAHDFAMRQTWLNGNAMVRMLDTFRDPDRMMRNGVPKSIAEPASLVSWTMLPFAKVVSNLLREGSEFVPGVNLPGLLDRSVPAVEQGTRRANALIGAGLMLWASGKATSGEITGDGPSNVHARIALMNMGWKPNSIRLGGRWYETRLFGPVAPLLNMVGNYHDEMQYDTKPMDRSKLETRGTAVAQAALRAAVDELGYAQDVSEFMNAVQGSPTALQRYLNYQTQGLEPLSGIGRNIASASEPRTPMKIQGGRVVGGVRRPYTGPTVFLPFLGEPGPANPRTY